MRLPAPRSCAHTGGNRWGLSAKRLKKATRLSRKPSFFPRQPNRRKVIHFFFDTWHFFSTLGLDPVSTFFFLCDDLCFIRVNNFRDWYAADAAIIFQMEHSKGVS